jgi:nitroimidazol reductase NimA-like FMN-containing flavoprotein (pyridoxamine 5'-phosphate oxidase superfamily)
MTEPVTTLDTRFSDPDAVPTDWHETRHVLETAQLFWISTVRGDGRPHVTPLVAVWLDDAIYFTTGPDEQKAVNLRGNAHVILMTGCNQWDSGLDVVIEGQAVEVADEELLQRLAGAWRTKWDGRWQYEARDGAFFHERGGTAACIQSRARQSIRVPQGHVQSDTAPVLNPSGAGESDSATSPSERSPPPSGAGLVEELQELVHGEVDLFVPPLGRAIVARNKPGSVDTSEISVDECVARFRVLGRSAGETQMPFAVFLPRVRGEVGVFPRCPRLHLPPVAIQYVLAAFDQGARPRYRLLIDR